MLFLRVTINFDKIFNFRHSILPCLMLIENYGVTLSDPTSTTIIGTYSTVATAIGTIVALFIAIFTLLELKKQREISYLPQIAVVESPFSILFDFPDCNLRWSNELSLDELRKRQKEKGLPGLDFHLNAYNVGAGVARDVTIKWDYQLDSMISQIKNNEKYRNLMEIPTQKSKEHAAIWGVNKGEAVIGVYLSEFQQSDFPFILPMINTETPTEFRVPKGFSLLFPIYRAVIFDAYLKDEISREEYENAGSLKLFIEYKDINSKKYSKTFTLRPRMGYQAYPTEVTPLDYHLEMDGRMMISELN